MKLMKKEGKDEWIVKERMDEQLGRKDGKIRKERKLWLNQDRKERMDEQGRKDEWIGKEGLMNREGRKDGWIGKEEWMNREEKDVWNGNGSVVEKGRKVWMNWEEKVG